MFAQKKKTIADIFNDLDPRMKLVLVVLFTTSSYLSQNTLTLLWNYVLIVVLYLVRGLKRSTIRTALLFAVFVTLDFAIDFLPWQGFKAGLDLIIFFLQRISIFFVMWNWMSTKLRISDLTTALQNMHIPKGAIITLAVVFRYLPTVSDEFGYISNTMKLRGIGLTFGNILKHPVATIEYALVPLIIRSMTVADELAASAMTRGLDLKHKRTSYREVRLNVRDVLITLFFGCAVFCGIMICSPKGAV